MKIRKATQKDVNKIGVIWSEFMDFHEQHDPCFKINSNGQAIFQKFISENIRKRKSLVLVAIEDKNIIAYLLAKIDLRPPVFANRQIGVICGLAVTSSKRRKNIGTELYERCVDWFQKHKIKRIELSVASTNPISGKFWQKHNFKPYFETRYKKI